MPQIGWFEILVVVVLALLVIGPKDFPVVIRKVGNWIGSIKRYFTDIQKEVTDLKDDVDLDMSEEKKYTKDATINKKNE